MVTIANATANQFCTSNVTLVINRELVGLIFSLGGCAVAMTKGISAASITTKW